MYYNSARNKQLPPSILPLMPKVFETCYIKFNQCTSDLVTSLSKTKIEPFIKPTNGTGEAQFGVANQR